MGKKKEPNEGTVPCLVCGDRMKYLTATHLSSLNCESGQPTNIESYRTWVAKEKNINPEDEIFDKNQIQKPQRYQEHAERLGLPK